MQIYKTRNSILFLVFIKIWIYFNDSMTFKPRPRPREHRARLSRTSHTHIHSNLLSISTHCLYLHLKTSLLHLPRHLPLLLTSTSTLYFSYIRYSISFSYVLDRPFFLLGYWVSFLGCWVFLRVPRDLRSLPPASSPAKRKGGVTLRLSAAQFIRQLKINT